VNSSKLTQNFDFFATDTLLMIENVLQKLTDLFIEHQARFRVLHHQACERTSKSVAEIRGTELGQGAKALCCTVKGNGQKQYVLGILPSDMHADLSLLASAVGGRRASLASPDEVMELTGCVFGAVPPVSFHPDLKVIIDPYLFVRYEEIAFNAGQLDASIIINAADFRQAVKHEEFSFIKTPVEAAS